MNEYFPIEQGIGYRMGTEVKPVLQVIANRFTSDNPPVPVTYYLRSAQNFHISEDYMDEVAIHEKFPEMETESYAYAWAKLTLSQAGPFHFQFSAFGPVTVFANGRPVYRTNHTQERFADQVSDLCLDLKEGDNSLLFQCVRTPLGCGFKIGSSSYKGRRIQFFGPTAERLGMSGFIWSQPVKRPLEEIPALGAREEETGLTWYPRVRWEAEEEALPPRARIFGGYPEAPGRILAATGVFCPVTGNYTVTATAEGRTELYLDGDFCGIIAETGVRDGSLNLRLTGGSHTVAFLGAVSDVRITGPDGGAAALQCPVRLAAGQSGCWLYAGPFGPGETPDVKAALTFKKPIDTACGPTFWRVDLPDTFIRPFNEGALYGEWNYPLGVTLYGMIQSARLLENEPLARYVEGHMRKCTDFYDYCMWDKAFYGAAPFHNQLTTIDSLDDCGSFASALLEVMEDRDIPEGRKIGDMVAWYMEHDQQRLEDGTFYRNKSYMPIMNETMWADDMYMSIPFLCRYYRLSGEAAYLDDAVRQVKNFYSYLYMPKQQIMSHIYDTHYRVQTEVPWGRGNGWTLFSITELLAVMPQDHPEREAVLTIYQNLCEGYLRLQGEEGMWHQVLTFPDSYPETSCTAMFVYGFARGVRYGWLTTPAPYARAARKGWEALCRTAVDWKGNIYGVCRGSGYSFSKEYYANDLGWNFNDTHGTGIVMLAGIEVEKMQCAERKDDHAEDI